MKAKDISRYLLIAFLAILWGACSSPEVESKFDSTPTERLNARKKELNDLLLSSENGWKLVYYTDNTQLGGWTHLFKFLPDGKVDMASDYDVDTDKHRSQYEIQLGSAVSLVFTTANRIHLLSESDNYPTSALEGQGYLGDFQFFYYGQENGEIIFKTNRKFHEIRFVKATANDWDDLAENTPIIESITGDMTSPLYRLLEINDGTKTQKFGFDYNANARFGIATSLDPGSTEIHNIALSFTPTSAISKPAVVVKGQELSNFLYNSVNNTFVATGTGGISATIKFTNEPTVLTDDYELLLPGSGNNVYGYIYNLTKFESANSALFLSLLENSEQAAGAMLSRVQLWFNNADGSNYIEYRFADATGATIARRYHYFTLTVNTTDKKVIFTPGVWKSTATAAAPAIATPSFLKNLDDQFMNPQGLYFAETPVSGYRAFTFTSTTTPFRMVAYSFQ